MKNFWLQRADVITEKEVILVRSSPETRGWYDRMPSTLSVIFPYERPETPDAFGPKIGIAHHLRYSHHGIEGVLKMPRKFHKMKFYVLHDKTNQPYEPFWVIVYK